MVSAMLRLACVAAVLAAGASGLAPAAPLRSPCRLATRGEVAGAFGGRVSAGRVDRSVPGIESCRFSVKRSNLGIDGLAVIFIVPGQTAATYRIARSSVPGAAPVSGIGTSAFYNPHTMAVELLKGRVVASAQAIFLNPGGPPISAPRIEADTIALARAVARRL